MSDSRMICALWVLATLFMAACGGGAPAATPTPTPIPDESSPLTLRNESAMSGAVTDTLHGVEVYDPYRALEEDNDATWAWIDAQNESTQSYLRRNDDPDRSERIETFLSIGYVADPHLAGGRVFYTKRDGEAEQGSIFVLDEGASEPRLLLDPQHVGDNVAVDWHFPSPRGTYLAYGLSRNGDERSTLFVMDVETGANLDDAIDHTKWASVTWLNDESAFFYTRYPRPEEPDYDEENKDTYNRHLFFHVLGGDPAEDPLVFRSPERTDHLWPEVSDDDRWVVVTNWRSWSETDLYLLDREGDGNAMGIVTGEDHVVYGYIRDGLFYLFSNDQHPNGRVLRAPVETVADVATWEELIPEGEGALEEIYLSQDYVVAHYVEEVTSKLRLFHLDGSLSNEVDLPMRGSVSGFATSNDSNRLVFGFNSFFFPPTIFSFEPADGTPVVVDGVQVDIDTSAYELDQVLVESADGTEINVYLVHRADMVPDGNQPILLNGYGGFKSSMMPGFQRNVLYWLEQGGVFASANIRGGGEFGEEWHRDGMLENKQNVFDDFTAVIRWLSESGLSNPERIAIIGASNGGLLMGAMLTQCPDAFRAAVSSVGLYDMVRFTEFPPAEIWMGEYGDPSEADAFAYLLGYSPYHSVEDGTAYPAALIETADQDSRVSWRHSTKFAAYLQRANASDREILFYMSREEGHGAGSGRSDIVDRYIRYYTFIETELGVR